MKIQNKHVVITGANRGIGLAVAMMCAKENAFVHLAIRKADLGLEKRLTDAGAIGVRTWVCDLASRAGVEKLIGDLGSQQIDILINNAGQLTGGLLEEQPLDDIYSMLQVNVASLIHLTRGLLPQMIRNKSGKIVNNSSVSAVMHFPCASTYAASKAAVLAFTNCIHQELAGTGVTTLALITPGIKTRMFDEIEVKYGSHLEVPKDSISPEAYAEKIRDAIADDRPLLEPAGATGIGLWVARHTPALFRSAVGSRFSRKN